MDHIVVLAGGVGGARMTEGLAQILPPDNLTVIVNTGDDFEHLGLKICPDLDTVCYTLAGVSNSQTGWGREGETWEALSILGALGGPTWFNLGDRDLGLHLERTRRLNQGETLSQVTQSFCQSMGIGPKVIPMSDEPTPTIVQVDDDELSFQEYFVHRKCDPPVKGFRFGGMERAQPAPGVMEAIWQSDWVLISPSNPWVSVDPILAVPGIKDALSKRPVVAVSPIIGGQTVKGPAAKMYAELGIEPSALAVAEHYADLLTGFVLDQVDAKYVSMLEGLEIQPLVTNTLMKNRQERRRLASEVIEFVNMLTHETR